MDGTERPGRLTDKDLAEAMRAAREAGGYLQAAFAERMEIREGTVSGWETRDNEGEPDRGFKVLRYFAELLRSDYSTRDKLLEKIGAKAPEESDPELERLVEMIQKARKREDWIDRRDMIEMALRFGRHGERPPESADPAAPASPAP
jgi:transcriptional regulator with XRE-family HTH domain